tara:strand:+ start:580 stop:1263 length:684 start_codon:yes stop_codon:yes gene_type:complete
MSNTPTLVGLQSVKHYRIIPSVYPSINFFEDLVDPDEMEMLWEIESLTNGRLRQETGDIFLVAPEDRVGGQGSSVVMAAFTHVGRPSRFTDGSYGVYYASFSQKTAICETVYHREQFLAATAEAPCELAMRLYDSKIIKPMHDIRNQCYERYHHPQRYHESQHFAKALRDNKSWGIVYHSVRDQAGQCVAVLRPKAITMPNPVAHLRYCWDGRKIVDVVKTKSLSYA